jgi:hypothetical protein
MVLEKRDLHAGGADPLLYLLGRLKEPDTPRVVGQAPPRGTSFFEKHRATIISISSFTPSSTNARQPAARLSAYFCSSAVNLALTVHSPHRSRAHSSSVMGWSEIM